MGSSIRDAKRAAARLAVDRYFPPQAKTVGIGSGSTVAFVVERIVERQSELGLQENGTVFVSTGYQSRELLVRAKLRIGEIADNLQVDVAFDGADEIDSELNCIKGGGACLLQEKLVAVCTQALVLVADTSKLSDRLGTRWTNGIPIEVVPQAWSRVMEDLRTMESSQPTLRLGGRAKAGPVVTDNGNFIIDAPFPLSLTADPGKLARRIKLLAGVVEVGIFANMATAAIFGSAFSGATVYIRDKITGKIEVENV